jgi:hypothetical protein
MANFNLQTKLKILVRDTYLDPNSNLQVYYLHLIALGSGSAFGNVDPDPAGCFTIGPEVLNLFRINYRIENKLHICEITN